MPDLNALATAVDDVLYVGPTNGTQEESPAPPPTVLYSLTEFGSPEAIEPDLGGLLAGLSIPLGDEDPAALADAMDSPEAVPATLPATTQAGGYRQLASAVDALAEAQNPMTMAELNAHLSRGGYRTSVDPYGHQLRATIRAIMRRQA